MNPTILLTFDVEDWFQVENFKPYIPFSTWPKRELRVEQNTNKLLDLLDQESDQPINGNGQRARPPRLSPPGTARHERAGESDGGQATDNGPTKKSPKATFFVLGWIAERLPHLVKEIHSRGHEVASHGYQHTLCSECSSEQLKRDFSDSKKRLEDITGAPVYGYRAPSFSIDDDILKFIQDCGYLYDSSYNSFGMHSRYGHLDVSRNNATGIAIQVNQKSTIKNRQFFELPLSNLSLVGQVLPWAGGGYFRLMSFPLFRRGVQLILNKKGAYIFYMHPWEIDPDQPRVKEVPASYKFRHYLNLRKTYAKLQKLLTAFSHCRFITCSEYLKEVVQISNETSQ